MHESRRQFADRLYTESHAYERIGGVAELTQTVVPVGAGLRVAVRDRS